MQKITKKGPPEPIYNPPLPTGRQAREAALFTGYTTVVNDSGTLFNASGWEQFFNSYATNH